MTKWINIGICLLSAIPANAQSPTKDYETCLYGYRSTNGNWVIPPSYESATEFTHGSAIVSVDDRYYLIDKQGKLIGDKSYYHLERTDFCNYIVISDSVNRKGLLSADLELRIKPKYQYISTNNSCKHLFYQVNDLWGIADTNGVQITGPVFTNRPASFGNGQNSIYRIYENDNWGLYDVAQNKYAGAATSKFIEIFIWADANAEQDVTLGGPYCDVDWTDVHNFTLEDDDGLGIDEQSIFSPKVYPTKVREHLTISDLEPGKGYTISIRNALGQSEFMGEFNAFNDEHKLSLGSLASGIHFIEIRQDNRTATARFFKY